MEVTFKGTKSEIETLMQQWLTSSGRQETLYDETGKKVESVATEPPEELFIVTTADSQFKVGELVQLDYDDGTLLPAYRSVFSGKAHYFWTKWLKPYKVSRQVGDYYVVKTNKYRSQGFYKEDLVSYTGNS